MTTTRMNALEIFKKLDRSNCRDCGLPTCMAFATAVASGRRALEECPSLTQEATQSLAHVAPAPQGDDTGVIEALDEMKAQIAAIDFEAAAQKLNAILHEDRLSFRCLGRIFEIDRAGELHSECHINRWIHAPLLDYVIRCDGSNLSREWVPFYELEGAESWRRFFEYKVEQELQHLADDHEDFLFDILDLFAAEDCREHDESISTVPDFSLRIRPLPKVPFLITYWRREDDLPSKLKLRFDRSAGAIIGAGSIFTLWRGIIEMLTRIILRHSV